MFDITQGKGFHITFANGYTASVQWGRNNYCENRCGKDGDPSANAECAAWNKNGDWLNLDGDSVLGHQSPAQVIAFLAMVSSL